MPVLDDFQSSKAMGQLIFPISLLSLIGLLLLPVSWRWWSELPQCPLISLTKGKREALSATPLTTAKSSSAALPCVLQAASQMFWTQTAARLRWEYYWPESAGKRCPVFNKETVPHLLLHVYRLHCFGCKLLCIIRPTSEESIKQFDKQIAQSPESRIARCPCTLHSSGSFPSH